MKYLEYIHTYRNRILWSLGVGILVMFVMYVYLVNQTIMHVVARQDAEKELTDVRAEVGALELSLIHTRGSITLALAENQGFVESKNTAFIARGAADEVVSFARVNAQ